MGFTAIAITLGLLAGLAAGGRPSAGGPVLRLWPVLVVGVALQWVPELLGASESFAFPALVASSLCLAAVAIADLRRTGMPVVLLGLVLNIAVVLPNGGMPVRPAALLQAGIVEADELPSVDLGSKRHLEEDDDVLVALGDVLPVRPLREVVSVGDLVLAAGAGTVVFRLLRPRPAGRRPSRRPHDDAQVGPVDAPAPDLRPPRRR